MKFVKVTSHNENFWHSLKEEPKQMAAALDVHFAQLKKLKEEGKLIDAVYCPNNGKCYYFFDFESETEVDQYLLDDPMGFTFDIEWNMGVPLFEHIPNALKTMDYENYGVEFAFFD